MEYMVVVVIVFYLLSTASYLVYLFLQKEPLQQAGYYLLLAGFLLHTVLIGTAVYRTGVLPARNMSETLSIASWALACVFLLLKYRFHLKVLGIFAAPLATITLMIAWRLPSHPADSDPLFKSAWLVIHVATIFIGEASFALACGVGILYLAQERAIKTKKHGFFFKRLPSLELLDSTGYACLVVGFSLLTAGLISGMFYAKLVWHRFWSWDVKEVWSFISWLLYAALLHQRLTVGWRGRRAAIMAIVGFSVLLFTFFGVNFLLKGHHGGFTQF